MIRSRLQQLAARLNEEPPGLPVLVLPIAPFLAVAFVVAVWCLVALAVSPVI